MNKNLTEIVFLLDRSGSMSGLESDTIGGFNALIRKQNQMKGETKVTVVLFDDEYEVVWDGVDAKELTLTENEYQVRGCTALLDAIGKSIMDVGRRLSQTNEAQRPGKVIFAITTDGEENASREFTYEKIKEMIKHQQETYSWEFLFLGANIDAAQEAKSIGIHAENAFEFLACESGVQDMYTMMEQEIVKRRVE
ncbi:VWA domain-containing protein [Ectobacillus sp. JY-23]|uniref:vWA domain-containing protein n=1 Tax=Ectobacillus sp. JY-23 TaxID=2933872 RepID=UPI001FF5DB91|nr:vWA domain-containing protein [Ectobacillus sp. JY-23]UOY91762.1 VWA domain-containing protein [Ectobacillus sp. JY-23]